MVSKRRNRQRRPARRASTQEPKRRLLVLCEGRVTEPEYLPGYDKHLEFSTLENGITQAISRARRLDQAAEEEEDPGRNPTTGVHRLVESIRGKLPEQAPRLPQG